MYIASLENQKSFTIIETIFANKTVILPVAIVQGKYYMLSWFRLLIVPGIRVLLSETGYTNSKLSLKYLDQLNQHLDSV
jgi:hypothetical protein